MKLWYLIFFAFLATACGTAEKPSTNAVIKKSLYLFNQEGTSSYCVYLDSSGGKVIENTNHLFYEHHALLTDIAVSYVIEESQTSWKFSGKNCEKDSLNMKFWKKQGDTMVLVNEISDKSYEHEFIMDGHDILKTSEEDCSDKLMIYNLYTLEQPDPILTYYHPFGMLQLPNTKTIRLIGFHPVDGVVAPKYAGGKESLVGVLTYSSKRGILQQVSVHCSDTSLLKKARQFPPKTFYLAKRSSNVIRRNDMDLYPDQGEDFYMVPTNFSIEINFTKLDDVDPIEIPVVNDKLQLDSALLPAQFSLHLIR